MRGCCTNPTVLLQNPPRADGVAMTLVGATCRLLCPAAASQKAVPAFLRQTTSVPSSPQWVPGAGAQCRAVFWPGTGTWVEVPSAPWQTPDALGNVLVTSGFPVLLQNKSEDTQQESCPCWDLAAHPQPQGLDCVSSAWQRS